MSLRKDDHIPEALRVVCREVELGNIEDPELLEEIRHYWKKVNDFNEYEHRAKNCRDTVRRARDRIVKLATDYNYA